MITKVKYLGGAGIVLMIYSQHPHIEQEKIFYDEGKPLSRNEENNPRKISNEISYSWRRTYRNGIPGLDVSKYNKAEVDHDAS